VGWATKSFPAINDNVKSKVFVGCDDSSYSFDPFR
jgi:hypothetical protein